MSTREDARRSYDDKLNRMGVKINTASMGEDVGAGHTTSEYDGTMGVSDGKRAKGYATAAENEETMAENAAKPRLDRKGYKNGGAVKKGTVVNVIVAPQGAPAGPPPMPPPPMPMPEPPPMPPHGAPGPAGAPPGPPMGMAPPGMPMGRATGGRVPDMDYGAGGGLGRLEKIKIYGKNAGKVV